MSAPRSDALVFSGATGDLAYAKVFPSLQAKVKRGRLDVPVIGVARAGWTLDRSKARAKDSLEKSEASPPPPSRSSRGRCATSTATTTRARTSARSEGSSGTRRARPSASPSPP